MPALILLLNSVLCPKVVGSSSYASRFDMGTSSMVTVVVAAWVPRMLEAVTVTVCCPEERTRKIDVVRYTTEERKQKMMVTRYREETRTRKVCVREPVCGCCTE